MTQIEIAVSPRPYAAFIENGILERAGEQLRGVLGEKPGSLFVITVPPVRRRWGKMLLKSLAGAGFGATVVEMPDGEPHKKVVTVERLAEKLAASRADREAVVVAFGGGVVGDVSGLLASIYMRGVSFVQVPTTVLAQVDASIGGKTGVNLRAGKNLLGTFHQPVAVLIDPEVLSTLPEREFRAGLYESLKCGIIGNEGLFDRLENCDFLNLRKDPDLLQQIITDSVRLKAEVVAADERESSLRRVLNLGHTIGHALEAESAYRRFLHGEAVGWGMVAAAHIAQALGRCENGTAERIRNAVLALGTLPKVNSRSRDILRLLQTDKKTRNGRLHFVLPRRIGEVQIINDVPEQVVLDAVDELRNLSGPTKRTH